MKPGDLILLKDKSNPEVYTIEMGVILEVFDRFPKLDHRIVTRYACNVLFMNGEVDEFSERYIDTYYGVIQ